jgi:hypothetical protein
MSTARSITEFKPKPRNDAYTGLLAISLVAMVAACALLFYDLKRYPSPVPPAQYNIGGEAPGGGPGGGGSGGDPFAPKP